jgi:hypothetical protein
VGGQKQADRGRQARYASNYSHWQVGRMKAVAGSGRAKVGGRQGKVEMQRQEGRNMQADRERQTGDMGRQGSRRMQR